MNDVRKGKIGSSRKLVIFISILIMLSGLLFSRMLLSLGLTVFAGACLVHRNITDQLKTFFFSPLLWSMSLLLLLPLVSGFWSQDIATWSQILRIKLPLLLLPVCFAGLNYFTDKDWQRIAFAFLILVIVGTGWSLWRYLEDANSVQEAYLRAQTIETPLGNDHVRFSLLVSIATLTSGFLLLTKGKTFQRRIVVALLAITFILVAYLHVLAARTGLICFYFSTLVFIIWVLWRQRKIPRYSWLLFIVLLLPFISWMAFPTFKNRISYIKYDLSFLKNDNYRSGSNDGNRLISIKAGWRLQNNHPLTGVGFGDIKNETDKLYQRKYPQMIKADKILPSSEWMIYGAGTGWPGFILFSMVMLIPFFIAPLQKQIAWRLLNISIVLSYVFDIGLEVQYGVFIHAFILLWWYKWLGSVPKVHEIAKNNE